MSGANQNAELPSCDFSTGGGGKIRCFQYHTICILIVYFGEWPKYFYLFLDSCKKNPSVDFLFIGDCGVPDDLVVPSNCRFIHLTLNDFNTLASERLKLNINITTPYKLCDLKPSYGEIFETYLTGYDLWGFSDVDLIHGDMRAFLTEDILSKHDAIFVREEYTTGSLFLLRNTALINALYRQSPDYVRVFEDSMNNYAFDECAGAWQALLNGKSIFDVYTPVVSFTEVVKKTEIQNAMRPLFKRLAIEKIPAGSSIFYDNGKVLCDGKEFILYHYVSEKGSLFFTFPSWETVPSKYRITHCGVFGAGEKGGILFVLMHRYDQILHRLKGKVARALSLTLMGRWNELAWHARLVSTKLLSRFGLG